MKHFNKTLFLKETIKALEKALKHPIDSNSWVQINSKRALVLFYKQRNRAFEVSETLCKSHPNSASRGILFKRIEQLSKALKFLKKADQITSQENKNTIKGKILNQIGDIYATQDQNRKAEKTYQKSLWYFLYSKNKLNFLTQSIKRKIQNL